MVAARISIMRVFDGWQGGVLPRLLCMGGELVDPAGLVDRHNMAPLLETEVRDPGVVVHP
jgi:hypothetical protein